ncbi:hypothetical protein [Thalassiella azotivora]
MTAVRRTTRDRATTRPTPERVGGGADGQRADRGLPLGPFGWE